MTLIYFSNDLKTLAERLRTRLFDEKAKPFGKRIIIVPSDRYKRFLQEVFAKDEKCGIAMGMNITTLSSWLASTLNESSGKILPSYALLEARLFTLLHTSNEDLLKNLSNQQCKTLCQELAHLFHKYGAQGDLFLKTWLQQEGWQQSLWKSIYANSSWGYSTEIFTLPCKTKEIPHLFGFSSLPPTHARYFKQLGAIFYLFSPCRLFWADLKNAKELAREGFIEENPSLLSSFGKWGRRLLNVLIAEEMESEEEYVEPEPGHTLSILQKSILDLEIVEIESDAKETIRVFSAKYRRQEVEELLEEILRILQKREDLCPSDILVLSPDLGLYVPHIHAVFQTVGTHLEYSIRGIERGRDSQLAQGISALFDLVEEKWSLEALLALFSQPLFALKKGWKKTELILIEKWLKDAGLTWGYDLEQRATILRTKSYISEVGSFRFALDRLLFGLTSTAAQEAPKPSPQIHWSEIELLNALVETAENLACDLAEMFQDRKKPLKTWLEGLSTLIDRYFSKEEDLWLVEEIDLLKNGCQNWEEPFFSWQDLKKICQELFSTTTGGFRTNHLHSIQFDLFEEGNILPKKVIMLLGMHDGAFPRTETESSLDQLEPKAPSKGEIDRFLFLEALLKAKDFFSLSFLHTCPDKRIELPPSLVIQELQNAMQRCGSKLTIRVLPDREYTVEALEAAPYFSLSRFKAAKAFYERKEGSHYFMPEWQERIPLPQEIALEESEIDIAQLQLLLRDPVEFYFKEKLGLPLEWVDETAYYAEEISLQTSAEKWIIERALEVSLDVAIKEYQREKSLPFGLFHDVAMGELKERFIETMEQCERHGIKKEKIHDITLGKEIAPWTVELDDGKKVTIRGKVKNVGAEGIIDLFKEKSSSVNVLLRWCDLLVLKGHPELQHIPNQLVLLEAKKEAVKNFDNLDPIVEMRKLLNYYGVAKQRLSPLLPSWSKMIWDRDYLRLERDFQENRFPPRYLKWLFKRDGTPNATVLCDTWSAFLQKTFSCIRGEESATI